MPLIRCQVHPTTPTGRGSSVKKLIAALIIGGAALATTAPAMAEPSACVHAYININGTEQTVDQCAP